MMENYILQIMAEMSSHHIRSFTKRVRKTLKGLSRDIEDEGMPCPTTEQIDQYVSDIVKLSVKDGDFKNMIEEDGSPEKWENDWIREYIASHSDFFEKWWRE